ncbi:hypothetical protein H257_18077 [Aphanomyces astaci]|uniref:Uncharacterized protein n=1 Tax=Aphanomyces astaci TaxID=112090 RepID=W4FCD4_APHAT|nr:hypothetical protein H257_18077 [Aphanomyces astaci]ETV65120.1 hypothetical protein H257_18077 [Aphanomyces astaci]|eukprot:XP_009845389.1 hypothetical protein H257_18077 [Aphanomyces astaci]
METMDSCANRLQTPPTAPVASVRATFAIPISKAMDNSSFCSYDGQKLDRRHEFPGSCGKSCIQ